MSCIYALEEFSIVLYLREENHFGSTIGTRIKVPKHCAIFFAGDLYHSSDEFDNEANMCLLAYCVPINVDFPLYQRGTMYREERTDITTIHMTQASSVGMDYGNELNMMKRVTDLMELRSSNVTERQEYGVILFLALFDYLLLAPKETVVEKDIPNAGRSNYWWAQQMYHQLLDTCMVYAQDDYIKTSYLK